MKRILRWLGYGIAALLALALLFAAWVWIASARVIGATHPAQAETFARPTPAQLADAERQSRILGCHSCHGEGMRGRLMFEAPNVVRLWAPNIPELARRASDQQLAAALRQGIGHDGRALFAMPSPLYQRLSDQEVTAMIAYIRRLPVQGEATSRIEWGPIGRFAIAMGGFPTALERMEEFRSRQPFDLGAAHAAGRRLVSIQCADCHGPDVRGAEPIPDVFSPGLDVVAAYSPEQFQTLMRTGVPPGGRDLGMMREAAMNDLRHYSDAEIAAIYAYLQARAARVQDPPRPTP